MSKSSSSRSVWSFIIKVIITVATAVGGLARSTKLHIDLCELLH